MTLAGACHCGAVQYRLEWPATSGRIPARRCQCGYCVRFNGTWTSHPDASLAIRSGGGASPGRYRFGTETAEFLFCAVCGVTVAALCETGDGLKAVLNVNTLEAFETLQFDRCDSDFEGESLPDRLSRRAANWIGTVTIEDS